MNVTIIYGTTSKESTYKCVQLLLNSFKLINMNMKIIEFFLPRNSPAHKRKYFPCLINGEKRLPHFYSVNSIVKSLVDSNLIILASPVVTCDISTEMKAFLDNLSYHCIQDKTNHSLHNKIGLVMSTASGAGLFHTTRNLKRNLNFWGISKIFTFSEAIYEMNLEYVSLKKNKKINEKISKLSNKILDLHNDFCTAKAPIFNKITSCEIEPMFKNNHFNIINFDHWKKHSCFHVRN